jgi:predicted PurR-regulated permease PerM
MTDMQVRRITWRTADVARVFVMAAAFLFMWRLFWLVHMAVFLVTLAVLIAIVLHVPARWLTRWIPFAVALPIVVLLFLGGLAGLIVSIIPEIAQQMRLLATELPQTLEQAQRWFAEQSGQGPDSALGRNITEQLTEAVGRFVPLAFNLITTLLGSFAIIVLAVFFAAQPGAYRQGFLRMMPAESRDRWEMVYDEVGKNLKIWTIGKAATMLAVGVCTYIGLTLFGIPGALALAAFAALLEFVPNFGPTIAAVPAILAAFAISPTTALYVTAFYFVLQQIQSAITIPLVERRAVNIAPALLMVWQLMLAIGFGILALFVATPLLAIVVVVVRMMYLEPREERERWDRRDAEKRDAGDADPVPAG